MKSRLTIMVDPDVARFFEEKYQAEVVRAVEAKRRIPSFSEYMNSLLRKYILKERAETLKSDSA